MIGDLLPSRTLLAWGLAIGAAVFFARLFLLGSRDPDYLFVATAMPAAAWALSFALVTASLRTPPNWRFLIAGINCALLAFLVQDMINFAFFVPGAAITFFALLAIPIAVAAQSGEVQPQPSMAAWAPHGRFGRWVLPAAACTILATCGVGLVLPVARCGVQLSQARAAAGRFIAGDFDRQPAYRHYTLAADADPLDPTPLSECAAWLLRLAVQSGAGQPAINDADRLLAEAIRRDPLSTSLHRLDMRVGMAAYEQSGDVRFLQKSVQAARKVVELYPQSPHAHADLGARLLDTALATAEKRQYREAAIELERALALDDARPDWEIFRRFPERTRRQIESQLARARSGADQPAPSP